MAPSVAELALPDRQNGQIDIDPRAVKLVREEGNAINDYPPEKPYSILLDDVPLTIERRPYFPKAGDKLVDAGTARTVAASNEAPHGTTDSDWLERHRHQTPVQQHCAYWDKDDDGIIWPLDTYRGCRAWGWNVFLSLLATFIINFNLSYPTCPTFVPDPFFRIYIQNVHKDK